MGFPSGNATNYGQGISVNVNGAYGDLIIDPQTGQYAVDVNTTGGPVYGQQPKQAAFLSQNIAGIPVMVFVAAIFLVALFGLARKI